jgi:hypothetical protein
MAVTVPSISCCVLNQHNLFYQIQNELAFNWDTCYHLALCLQLLPFHCNAASQNQNTQVLAQKVPLNGVHIMLNEME